MCSLFVVCGAAIRVLPKNVRIMINPIFRNSLQKRYATFKKPAVFIIAHAALSCIFLTRELSCWEGIDGMWINPSLTNLHPLMRRRASHILISGFGRFTPCFLLRPILLQHQVLENILIPQRTPQLCFLVTLQSVDTAGSHFYTRITSWLYTDATPWLYIEMAATT